MSFVAGPKALKWRDNAACRGEDQELFYDHRGTIAPSVQRLCHTCPVRNECLNEALERRETHGIWAGTSPATRRAILRGRPRATCPACASVRVLDLPGIQACASCALSWPVRALAAQAEGGTAA